MIRDQRIRKEVKHSHQFKGQAEARKKTERKRGKKEGGRNRGREGGRKGEQERLHHLWFAGDVYTITVCKSQEERPITGQI